VVKKICAHVRFIIFISMQQDCGARETPWLPGAMGREFSIIPAYNVAALFKPDHPLGVPICEEQISTGRG
jgi:hypothetical protein